jgi:arylsulfatase A-like enzyme
METTRAIPTDRWKFISRFPDGPFELYDLQTDPQKRFNQFDQPGTDEIKAQLAQQLDTFFTSYADPKDDLWKIGCSQAKRTTIRAKAKPSRNM